MITPDKLDWILKTLDLGRPVPGWFLTIEGETYYLINVAEGQAWIRIAGRAGWKRVAAK